MPFTDDLITRLKMVTGNYDKGVKGAGKKASGFGKVWSGLSKHFVVTAGDMVNGIKAISGALIGMISRGGTVGDVMANTTLNIDAVSRAAAGLVSKFDLAQASNKIFAAGLDITQKQFEAVVKAATIMGQKTGTDTVTAIQQLSNSLVTGASRGLKPFGIQVDVLTGSVTEAEKALHVKTTALKALVEQYGEANVVVDDAGEKVQQLAVAWQDSKDAVAVSVAENPNTIESLSAVTGAVEAVTSSWVDVDHAIKQLTQSTEEWLFTMKIATELAKAPKDFKLLEISDDLPKWAQAVADAQQAAADAAERLAKKQKKRTKATKGSTKADKEAAAAAKVHAEELDAIRDAAIGVVDTMIMRQKAQTQREDEAARRQADITIQNIQAEEQARMARVSGEEETARAIMHANDMRREANSLEQRGMRVEAARMRIRADQHVATAQALDAENKALRVLIVSQVQAGATAAVMASIMTGSWGGGLIALKNYATQQAVAMTLEAAGMAAMTFGLDPRIGPTLMVAAAWAGLAGTLSALGVPGSSGGGGGFSVTTPMGTGGSTSTQTFDKTATTGPSEQVFNVTVVVPTTGIVESGRTTRRAINAAADEDGEDRI